MSCAIGFHRRVPSLQGLFITGTDTGVGKTHVAVAIVRRLRALGLRVGAYKPAVSGSEPGPQGTVWSDVERLAAACDRAFPAERICPQRFHAPLAPPAAARAEGRSVDRALLREGARWWRGEVDYLVVEGAGGLLAPIADDDLVADLARDLGFPLLIVARAGLGTINHTLLTVEAAQRRGLDVGGIVLNDALGAAPGDPSVRTNPQDLARHCQVPVLGNFPQADADALLQHPAFLRMDWLSLMRRGCAGLLDGH
jgi:dethiobiotin synthetase